MSTNIIPSLVMGLQRYIFNTDFLPMKEGLVKNINGLSMGFNISVVMENSFEYGNKKTELKGVLKE